MSYVNVPDVVTPNGLFIITLISPPSQKYTTPAESKSPSCIADGGLNVFVTEQSFALLRVMVISPAPNGTGTVKLPEFVVPVTLTDGVVTS